MATLLGYRCRLLPLILAVAITAALDGVAVAERVFTEQALPDARLFYQGEIPIAIFRGTPEEMGRQQAALLAGSSQELMEFPKKFMAEFGAESFWPLAAGAAKTLMMQAPKRYQRELAAASEHADFDEQVINVANTLLELRRLGCSTLIVDGEHSAEGGPLFGRNFDFPTLGLLNRFSILAIYQPNDRHAFASVGFPGIAGVFSGMNDAGLAVATLDVYHSGDGSAKFSPGVPLALVFRRILEECRTVDEAEAVLRERKGTTWMNLAVCDRKQSAVFEITPKQVARRESQQGLLACTNHFQTAGLTVGEECWRIPHLVPREAAAKLTLADVQNRLAAVSFETMTLQTMVFEPASLKIHLALGEPPTAKRELTEIDLAKLFAEKRSLEVSAVGAP